MVKTKEKYSNDSKDSAYQNKNTKNYRSFRELLNLLDTFNNVATQEEKIIFLIYEYTSKGQKINRRIIEKQLNMYRQKVERIIDELYYKRFVLRHIDQENRIKYYMTLTKEGMEFIRKRVCDYAKALNMLAKRWKIDRKKEDIA